MAVCSKLELVVALAETALLQAAEEAMVVSLACQVKVGS